MSTKKDKYEGVEKLDMTPSWSGLLPVYLEAFEHGNPSGREAALSELKRMAVLADKYAEIVKKRKNEPETPRLAVLKSDRIREQSDFMNDETYSKYMEFLAQKLGCAPEDVRLIISIDDVEEISGLSDYIKSYKELENLTDKVDGINPTMVNDGHHLVLIGKLKVVTYQNASPMGIYIAKSNLKKFENKLKPL